MYGRDARWAAKLDPPVLVPPSPRSLKRYAIRMLGIYPARGCPYTCNFCSVIKISGRQVRSQPVETTVASLKAAKAAGVRSIVFTSDNLNKYSEVRQLLQAMIDERLELPWFCQCDTQIARQEDLIELMGRAGCFQMLVGAESFSRQVLLAAHKFQNHPDTYGRIVELCRRNRISTHFSNIIGFPSDTREDVLEHLRRLRELQPDVASFYILTPIPGTEQYEEFLSQGLIHEKNLDRFDATCVTWNHPHLAPDEWMDLMLRCYREIASFPDVAAKLLRHTLRRWDYRTAIDLLSVVAYAVQWRLAASQRRHPMAGGSGRVRLDAVSDYAHLRREYFGVDLVPLPHGLRLSARDEQLNRAAKLPANFHA